MTLEKNQPRTGHLNENVPNDVKKTGRSDGTEGGQSTIGHHDQDVPAEPNKKRPTPGDVSSAGLRRSEGEEEVVESNFRTEGDTTRVGAMPLDVEDEVEE